MLQVHICNYYRNLPSIRASHTVTPWETCDRPTQPLAVLFTSKYLQYLEVCGTDLSVDVDVKRHCSWKVSSCVPVCEVLGGVR